VLAVGGKRKYVGGRLHEEPGRVVENLAPEVEEKGRHDEHEAALLRFPLDEVRKPFVVKSRLVEYPGTDMGIVLDGFLEVERVADGRDVRSAPFVPAPVGKSVGRIFRKPLLVERIPHEKGFAAVGRADARFGFEQLLLGAAAARKVGNGVSLFAGHRGVAPEPGRIFGLARAHGADYHDGARRLDKIEMGVCLVHRD